MFPEGTCINNTSVMQFKKGSFEVGSVIYPVAIKVGKSSYFIKNIKYNVKLIYLCYFSMIQDLEMHFGIVVNIQCFNIYI